jgi:cell division septum initiation protein DivIVA
VQLNGVSNEITALEERIAVLEDQLMKAKEVVRQWEDTNSSLSQSAAEARAKNQGMGRGILGTLLGSKYRSTLRSAAANSNAVIAKDVAQKRRKISEGKKEAQELTRKIQSQLTDAKQKLKALKVTSKTKSKDLVNTSKKPNESLELLKKLKQAHDVGIITDSEFEEKRKKIISQL